jgi:tetratricopeptide (TPR) repeat protein
MGLAQMGYVDLADEVLAKIGKPSDGELAVLRVKVVALHAIGDRKVRLDTAGNLAGQLRAWIQRQPESPKVLEAAELLSDSLQVAGRAHALNRDFVSAEAAFAEAIKAMKDQVDKVKTPAEAVLFANYHYLQAHLAKIEALREHPNALAMTQAALSSLRGPIDDFLFENEFTLEGQHTLLRVSRSQQILAELQVAAKDPAAERTLAACFSWIPKSRLLTARGGPAVQELSTKLVEHEMSANNLYAGLLRARGAKDFKKRYEMNFNAPNKLYQFYPDLKTDASGVGIRIESAKSRLGAGQTSEAIKIVRALLKEFRDPSVRARVMLNIGDFVSLLPLSDRLEIAQFAFEFGDPMLAAKQFQEIRASGDPSVFGKCTLRIGQCYYAAERFLEAMHALKELMDPRYPEAPEAAVLLYRALRRLAAVDPKYVPETKAHESFMIAKGWGSDEMIRNQAIDKENQKAYAEAIPLWQKLAAEGKLAKTRMEATARIGYDHVRLSETEKPEEHWRAALASFREFQKKSGEADPEDALMTLSLGSYVLARLAKTAEEAQEILEWTKDVQDRFPNAPPEMMLSILARRIEALQLQGKPTEAEAEFKELRAYYRKAHTGITHYHRTVKSLVAAFRNARMFDKEIEYIKELPESHDYEHIKWLAVSSYKAGRYAEAREMIEKLLGSFIQDVRADKEEDMQTKLQYWLARSYAGEKNFAKALQMLELLEDVDRDPEVQEFRGDLLYETGKTLQGNARVQKMQDAEGIFGKVCKMHAKGSDAYYRNVLKWARTLFEHGPGQARLAQFFQIAIRRGEAPSWGNSASKDELNQLLDLTDKKIPFKGR